MAITDKNRKTLWGRSGNRCAMCRNELVAESNENKKNLNIGDECHIISKKPNGPRHISDYQEDYDDYENLILLCKNHHKTIDELWETYTVELLKLIKANHENWIKTVIDNAKGKTTNAKLLPRIRSGKQIVDIINKAHAYQFDHCVLKTQEEMVLVSSFLQNIQDWGEATGFEDFEIGRLTELGFNLNVEIEELEKNDFWLFGEHRSSRMTNANKDDLGVWDIATLIVVRKNDLAIIDGEFLAAKIT